jgi:hypothetical protein
VTGGAAMDEVNNETATRLEMLCDESQSSFNFISRLSYWTAEVYGFGKYIRKYGYYPKWLPLCIYTDHSPGNRDAPSPHELASSAPVQVYHSSLRVKQWKGVSKKLCYCLYSPYVFCRKKNKIEKSVDAVGTIAFPAHTTDAIDDVSNIQAYIDQLKKLPAEFQPVSVCLHMTDINKEQHKIFIKNGFEVYTAGHAFNDGFIERFYSIIKNFKYSTSNLGGSYLYYCVEMGIPFFLYGDGPRYINKSDPNIEKGEYTSYKKQKTYQELVSLFSAISTTVTEEQRSFVHKGLGVDDGLGRMQMAAVLYYSLFRCIFRLSNLVYIFRRLRKMWQRAQ